MENIKKSARKKDEKRLNISDKNNPTPINSTTPASSRASALSNTLHIIIATQTFDDNQARSIFG